MAVCACDSHSKAEVCQVVGQLGLYKEFNLKASLSKYNMISPAKKSSNVYDILQFHYHYKIYRLFIYASLNSFLQDISFLETGALSLIHHHIFSA